MASAFVFGATAVWLNRGLAFANGDDLHFGDLPGASLVILIVAGAVAALALGLFILKWVQSPRSAPDSPDSPDSTGDAPQESDDGTEG